MRFDEIEDPEIINLINKSVPGSNGGIFICYVFKTVAYSGAPAANDSIYSEIHPHSSHSHHSSDKNTVKTYRFLRFLINLLKRFFCHSYWLVGAWLLGFLASLAYLTEGQNNHSPTMDSA